MSHPMTNHPQYKIYDPGQGETIEIGGARITRKVTGAETGDAFALVEVTVPPHFCGSSFHLHRQTTEAFYVVRGMLAFTLDQETIIIRQGSFILVQPGAIHRFWNPTAAPAAYLAFVAPGKAEGYYAALAAQQAAQSPASTLDEVGALGMEYDYFPAPTQAGDL